MTIADALALSPVEGLDLSRYVRVAPQTPVADTVTAMREAERATACIVGGERLVGIFTQRDILHRVIGRPRDWGAGRSAKR